MIKETFASTASLTPNGQVLKTKNIFTFLFLVVFTSFFVFFNKNFSPNFLFLNVPHKNWWFNKTSLFSILVWARIKDFLGCLKDWTSFQHADTNLNSLTKNQMKKLLLESIFTAMFNRSSELMIFYWIDCIYWILFAIDDVTRKSF